MSRTRVTYNLQNGILWSCLTPFFNFIIVHKLRFYKITGAWSGKWLIWGNHVIYYIRASLVFPWKEEMEPILRSLWMFSKQSYGKTLWLECAGGRAWQKCPRQWPWLQSQPPGLLLKYTRRAASRVHLGAKGSKQRGKKKSLFANRGSVTAI